MNLALKFALVAYPDPAYRVAFKVGTNPNKLSRFVTGLSSPTEEERESLARVLGKPAKDLFPVEKQGVV